MRITGLGLFPLLGAAAALVAGCDDSPTGLRSLDCTEDYPRLEIGGSVSGTLAAGDEQLSDGTFFDFYSLAVQSTETITIRLTSTEFDAYLYLLAESEIPIEVDNDSGGGTDAELVVSLTRGCYLVAANSVTPETGSYTVSAEETAEAG